MTAICRRGGFNQVECADHVFAPVAAGVLHRFPHLAERRKMHDRDRAVR